MSIPIHILFVECMACCSLIVGCDANCKECSLDANDNNVCDVCADFFTQANSNPVCQSQ